MTSNNKIVAYRIYDNLNDFLAKSQSVAQSGQCGNSAIYADPDMCKHPTLNLWAMPVMEYVENLFLNETLDQDLSTDWIHTVNKQ